MFTLNNFSATEFVLDGDEIFMASYNKRGSLKLDQYPEPFVGNFNKAKVLILGGNPGYDAHDSCLLQNVNIRKTFESIIIQSYYPYRPQSTFYWLNDMIRNSIQQIIQNNLGKNVKNFSGFEWWEKRTRELVQTCGKQNVEEGICYIDFYPYHSVNLSISGAMKNLPSSLQIDTIINNAIKNNKIIVITRAKAAWKKRIPALNTYCNVIDLKNPRCAYITSRNMKECQWKTLIYNL